MGELRQRGKVWWIRYYRGGQRFEESSGSTKKGVAKALLQQREGAVANGEPISARMGRLRFEDAARDLLNEYEANGRKSLPVARRRVNKHLLPYFRGLRMVNITAADVRAYVAHRRQQGVVAVKGARRGARVRDVSNAEINRELALLKRAFSLAVQAGSLLHRPHIPMLVERNARAGFLEPEHVHAMLAALPGAIADVVLMGYVTGWRISSEVLPLQWRQVDFGAGEIRLDADTTKNRQARTFPLTDELRAMLERRHAEHLRLKKAGQLCPFVFWRMVAKGRGGPKSPRPITTFTKAWTTACRVAGCPGRIPHDLRRTAIRNMVRRGVPERVAMQLAGHETRSIFDRYNITSPGDLRAAGVQLSGLTGVAPALAAIGLDQHGTKV